jgi:RNA polymerase sigma-70 factor (ECF subfamily)
MSLSDEELLVANTPEAFGEFYDRHARTVLGYFARRTHDPEAAADLTAETFASAIVAQRRFTPGGAPATAWLFAIASRRLADYQRRGWVDARTRRSLAMERRPLGEDDREMIRLLADEAAADLLTGLPADQRAAVIGHVVEDRGYAELAEAEDTSEAAIRQRVSRGLSALRRRMGVRV